jgi:hypothetical protein
VSKNKYAPPQHHANGQTQYGSPNAVLRREIEITDDAKVPEKTKSKTAQNIRPSMCARIWTWIKEPNVVIAIATVVIAVVGILQWNILSRQLDEAAREFNVSHRPWVSLTGSPKITNPLRFDTKGPHVEVVLTLRNAGSAPAIGVVTNMHLVPVPESPKPAWVDLVKPECTDKALMERVTDREGGDLLVPQIEIMLPKRTVDFRDGSTSGNAPIFLMGCIGYYAPGEDTHKSPPHRISFTERFVTLIPSKTLEGNGHFETEGWGDAKD